MSTAPAETLDPRRLLDDVASTELALPELLSVLPSLVRRQAFTLAQIRKALDEYLEAGRLNAETVERIRQYLPETQSEPDDVRPASDDDEDDGDAATVVAYPQAGQEADDDEDGAATVVAYPSPSGAGQPPPHPGDDDDAATVIAYPRGDGPAGTDEDEAPTVVHTVAPTTNVTDYRTLAPTTSTQAGTSTGMTGTSTRTSQLSWDLKGATSPQLQKLGPGSIIKDRFILDKVLGAGGMGKVFQARDLLKVEAKDSNPYVAMKVLTEDFKAHPQAFIALQREASRQQKLAHPNIATVYDFDRIGMTGTQVFITMELLVGQPLDKYIRKEVRPKGGLPFEQAFPIIQQLGAALIYAHKQGLVHSDFKPGNAFFCDDGVVKTLDFGIARAASGKNDSKDDEKTEDKKENEFDAGSLGALTPAYASLEMLQGKDPSTQDDLYALACVAYELLTGYHPFNKKSALQAQEAKLVPAPIKALKKRQMKGLLHGLAFEKEKRTPTVEKFLEELEGKPTWHKNPYVLGSAFAVVLAIAAYNPIKNYLADRRVQSLIADVQTGQPALVEQAIERVPQLDVNARNRVAQGGRDVFQRYFRDRINAAVNLQEKKYDFASAEKELQRMALLFPDSVALTEQTNALELQRNRYLLLLGQQINLALKNEWLLPDANNAGKNVMDILSKVAAVSTKHELLRDPRIPDAYATKAQEAINIGNLVQARTYLDVSLARLPDDIDLINTQDRWQLAKDKQDNKLQRSPQTAAAVASDGADKEKLLDDLLNRVKALEEAKRYSLAQAELDDAKALHLDAARIAQARSQVDAAYKKFLSEREQAAQQASITGLQNNLMLEIRAREMDAAETSLRELKNYIGERDPFITVTAAEAMSAAYLELARNQSDAKNYQQAVKLAERGLVISPNDIQLQQMRERNVADYDIGELNRLFASAQHFDTPAAQKMLGEVKNYAPDRYPDLERQYTGALAEHVAALAQGGKPDSRSQAESLATRASILFPDNQRLSQLRAQLAPPPWIEGRTARAALSTGRLNEAQGMLDAARKRLPDHPEVLDFAKDLKRRTDDAKAAFAQYQASLDAGEFEKAREQLGTARQLWSDNPTYRGAISVLSQKMAAQRWQGRVLQRDVDVRTLAVSGEGKGMTGADVAGQPWTPVESTHPCTEDQAGLGRRARAICFDMLHERVRGPLMVVVPPMKAGQNYFAVSKYEVSNEDYNKYCFFTGQCKVEDSRDKALPRVGLSAAEILAYTTWLSARTGHTYRLPTRTEWLYVADAAGQQPPKDYNCTVRLGGQVLKGDQLTPVSSGHQNGWGLQNYIGNAQELVQADGSHWLALGGSFQDPHAECSMNFSRAHSDKGDDTTGFRLLLEQVGKPPQTPEPTQAAVSASSH